MTTTRGLGALPWKPYEYPVKKGVAHSVADVFAAARTNVTAEP